MMTSCCCQVTTSGCKNLCHSPLLKNAELLAQTGSAWLQLSSYPFPVGHPAQGRGTVTVEAVAFLSAGGATADQWMMVTDTRRQCKCNGPNILQIRAY